MLNKTKKKDNRLYTFSSLPFQFPSSNSRFRFPSSRDLRASPPRHRLIRLPPTPHLPRQHTGGDADQECQRPGLQLPHVRAGSAHWRLWQPGADKASFPGPAGRGEWQDPGGRRPAGHQRTVAQGAVLSSMYRFLPPTLFFNMYLFYEPYNPIGVVCFTIQFRIFFSLIYSLLKFTMKH